MTQIQAVVGLLFIMISLNAISAAPELEFKQRRHIHTDMGEVYPENGLRSEVKWLDEFVGSKNTASTVGRFYEAEPASETKLVKRGLASRKCGSKLVEAIIKVCSGCVKPAGAKAVSTKRSLTSATKRSISLTEKCCINRCTYEDMRSFCCE